MTRRYWLLLCVALVWTVTVVTLFTLAGCSGAHPC